MSRLRRIGIQGLLGLSAGLPLYLTRGTLAAWLKDFDIDWKALGAFMLVSLPYNFKFLWAPLLDRFGLPWLNRRRDWMISFQLLLVAAIALLGSLDPGSMLGAVAAVAVSVAFLSASQDIVVDAYRTDLMPEDERGRAAGLYVLGYRVGMIATSAGALMVADWVSWRAAFYVVAGGMLIGVASTLAAPAVPVRKQPTRFRDAVVDPLREFFTRRGVLVVLAFLLLYKVGETIAAFMTTPFLLYIGYQKAEVAVVHKIFGFGAAIVGAIAGGVMIDRFGVRRGLLVFGLAQAVANIGYAALAIAGPDAAVSIPSHLPFLFSPEEIALEGPGYLGLVAAVGIDNLCNGFGTAAFLAYLMSLCHQRFSATQYALFSSASTLIAHVFGAGSGYVVAQGWVTFYVATIAAALPALLLVPWLPAIDDETTVPSNERR